MPFARSVTRARAPFAILALLIGALAASPPRHPAATTVVTGRVTSAAGLALGGAVVAVDDRSQSATTAADGRYVLSVTRNNDGESVTIRVRRIGFQVYAAQLTLVADTMHLNVKLQSALPDPREQVAMSPAAGAAMDMARHSTYMPVRVGNMVKMRSITRDDPGYRHAPRDSGNTEAYDPLEENSFRSPRVAPLSTFSADVDRASYGNVRRFLTRGELPPKDAVRIEELVNYFPYGDPAPAEHGTPLRISTEVSAAPWNTTHDLVRVALRARDVDMHRAPASNLVFLVDVSGSMDGPGRLPLVKQALGLLVNELREEDHVAIVVYAGNAGLVLPSTSGGDKQKILAALDGLSAGGSTAGGAGIKLAYDIARQHFIRSGNNRVILCTDGDFNVGQSSDGELVRLIEQRRTEGAYLTILGFGMGNYKDSKMEKLAGAGNGNYAYIDDLLEARKMLVKEMGGTLLTVAKDVKLQVEFNPARVQAYRLIGYEDRLLRDEDFTNDARDAGDIGAGHTVTALYEIVPTGARLDVQLHEVGSLRYQNATGKDSPSDELLHVAMRYKAPDGDRSMLVTHPVRAERSAPSEAMRFASAVAGFGMLLRDSPHRGTLTWQQEIALARGAMGKDEDGYRADFIRLSELAAGLNRKLSVRN